MKFRFEILPFHNKAVCTIYMLKGDFSTGEIKNAQFEFENYESLQKSLNAVMSNFLEK